MKLGLGPYPAATPEGNEGAHYRRVCAHAALAEEEGFDSVWLEPGRQLSGASPFPLGAAVARRTRALRIVVRPRLGLTHPVYAAEDTATLDLIAAGRAVLAPSAWPDADSLGAYGIPAGEAGERF